MNYINRVKSAKKNAIIALGKAELENILKEG